MNSKEIMKIAVDRLDTLIAGMNLTTSELTRTDLARAAHDLVKIIKLAGEFDEEVEGDGAQ
jgi:hypothetical protein